VLDGRQVVETFLDEEPDDAIRVKDEVCPIGLSAANDSIANLAGVIRADVGVDGNIRQQSNELWRLGQNLDIVKGNLDGDSSRRFLAL
jgi:hypothetical protein